MFVTVVTDATGGVMGAVTAQRARGLLGGLVAASVVMASCGSEDPGRSAAVPIPIENTQSPVGATTTPTTVEPVNNPPPAAAGEVATSDGTNTVSEAPPTLVEPQSEWVPAVESGAELVVPQLVGFASDAGVKRNTTIPGLTTQVILFESVTDEVYENYSVALLAGPEVAKALESPERAGFRPVDGLTVGGSQVYSRTANLDSAYPSYEFAWQVSDDEVVNMLSEYIGEERLLEVASQMGASK